MLKFVLVLWHKNHTNG